MGMVRLLDWTRWRHAAALTALGILVAASPALAQNSARISGMVTDPNGEAVEGATIVIEFTGGLTRRVETTTNDKGEFVQIGLRRGPYAVTATKDGVGALTGTVTLNAGQTFNMDMQLLAPGDVLRESLTEGERAALERAEATVDAFDRGLAALPSGNLEEALDFFQEAIDGSPECGDCHRNLGMVYARQRSYAEAEASLRRAVELEPDDLAAYRALAEVYNAQRRFDDAAEATAQAARISGSRGRGGATAVFDQGLIFWNAGRVAEARQQFEQTLRLDPNHGEAHYWLGIANLNEGNVAEAAAEMKIYLEAEPNGRFVAEANGILASIQP